MPADQPEAKTVPVYAEKLAWLEAQEAPEAPGQRGRTLAKRAWTSLWPKALAIIIVLAIWELIHISGWKKDIFPGPGGTLANLGDQLNWTKTGLLWHAIGTTSERAVIGFGLAVLIGAVVGALVSRIGPLRAAVGSLITGLQTMPSIAWFPFAIILFGVSTTAILFVIVLGAAPSIANGLIAGVDYTPPILLRAGATMGLRRFALYRHLILPASLPALVAGLQAGLGVRLAQPDGRRAARHHRQPALPGRAAVHRPGPGRHAERHRDHHRDPGHRHSRAHPVQHGRPRHPPPLGPGRQFLLAIRGRSTGFHG
jgi:ABC-type nitrate/sulfonate/bicarbonate transport system permease component